MNKLSIGLGFKIFQWAIQCVLASFINFAGGNHVANHFAGIFKWYNAAMTSCYIGINPIFPVVFVAPLMVKPGFAVAIDFAADCKRRAMAIVIFYTFNKFGRSKFAHVVKKTLNRDSGVAAEFKNLPLMMAN